MHSTHFLVLNMDKNKDRLDHITKNLNTYNIPFTRVKAINGFNMENNNEAKIILKPRKDLLGTLFQSVETKKKWIEFLETNNTQTMIDLVKYPVITEKTYLSLYKNTNFIIIYIYIF